MFPKISGLSTHPVDVGLRSEAAVIAELNRRGYCVLLPFGFNNRYDFVIHVDDRFLRVQCKTGRLREGVIMYPTRSTRCSTSGIHFRDYDGEVDLFIVYCPQNEKLYAIPPSDLARGAGTLRVDPPANNQVRGIRWAVDYELPA
jgi:hypothetical protein